jgi:hypothetical protein
VAGEPKFTIVDPPRSIFRRKRFLLPFGISAVTAVVSAIALFASGAVAMPFTALLEALMASKVEYFNDPQVRRILMANGIEVHVTNSSGSMGVKTNKRKKANEYDFVMPSGQMVGEAVHKELGGQRYFPFSSPLVLGAFRDYAEALKDVQVATPQPGGEQPLYYTIDIRKLIEKPRYWNQNKNLTNTNQMIAQSPDPCQSYSGAAYVGLVAFAANEGRTMTEADVPALAAKIKPVLSVEGQHESGLGTKFFNQEGKTFAPVAVFYEHQYLAYQFRVLEKTGKPDTDRVLLYPEARHTTEPWLIAYTKAGEKVGELLESDPGLRKRALELGYRVSGERGLNDELTARGMHTPLLSETESFMPKSGDLAKLIHEVYGCEQVEVPW